MQFARFDQAKIGNCKLPLKQIIIQDSELIRDPGVVGIIGQDIISAYPWKFDFENKTIEFSENSFPEPPETNALVWPFSYRYKTSLIPRLNLNIKGKGLIPLFLIPAGPLV